MMMQEVDVHMHKNDLSVTIIIPTVGRRLCVEDCAKSLNAVEVPQEVELVIIDAGGEGEVDALSLQELRPNSRVIKSAIRNAGIQRNMGVKLAQGEIVIFLDDDCIVQAGWWPEIIKPLIEEKIQNSESRIQDSEAKSASCIKDGEGITTKSTKYASCFTPHSSPLTNNLPIACVAGAIWMNPHPVFTDNPGGFVNWFGIPSLVTHRSEKAPREVDWPISCNMACLKKAYVAVGGMADIYGVYDEDIDFGLKVRHAGFKIIFQSQAAVYHYSLLRKQPEVTKRTEFRAGRNRAMLLVRNYGLSIRLVLFLITSPVFRVFQVLVPTIRFFLRSTVHALSYMSGVLLGVVVGIRHPVKEDMMRFEGIKTEEE
jgi:GT2 family glycosyltransferase